jgi:hypothetical protein
MSMMLMSSKKRRRLTAIVSTLVLIGLVASVIAASFTSVTL